jgi:uncharacterized protein YkwD
VAATAEAQKQKMRLINVAILLITLTASAHTVEQNSGGVLDPGAQQVILPSDNALVGPIVPVSSPATMPIDTAPIETPPLPRPKPPLHHVTGDNPAALISAFRHQHGKESVAISPALTRVAQEQANAMAARDSLDHNVLAPFSSRIDHRRFNRAAENIAYGYADFASTLKQWTNSAGHRANLLLHGAKWIGVAHAQNGHRMYWALVIGGK